MVYFPLACAAYQLTFDHLITGVGVCCQLQGRAVHARPQHQPVGLFSMLIAIVSMFYAILIQEVTRVYYSFHHFSGLLYSLSVCGIGAFLCATNSIPTFNKWSVKCQLLQQISDGKLVTGSCWLYFSGCSWSSTPPSRMRQRCSGCVLK